MRGGRFSFIFSVGKKNVSPLRRILVVKTMVKNAAEV